MTADESGERTGRLIEATARLVLFFVAALAAMFVLGMYVGASL